MCRTQVTVALSGEGADELFGGYQTYLADRYAETARLVPSPLRRLGLSLAQLMPPSDEKIGFEYKVQRFLEGTLLSPEEAHFFWNGTFRNGELAPRFPYPQPGNWLLLDQQHYLTEDILHKCDRMSMAHSLEVRPPFLDHRIVEFANQLPDHLKIRGSKLKYLLRETMRDKLPASILRRGKQGFDIPVHQWLRGVLKNLLLGTLAEAPKGVVDLARVHGMAGQHLTRQANYGYHLWGLLILFLWMKRWKIATD
jgi:asparagine synthase (glutamine-hydrolysing)